MRLLWAVILLLLVTRQGWGAEEFLPEPVIWKTPSADYNGTMPLGNGEIGLNAWVEDDGALRFFIGRTDSWDDYGRLLKVGALRISVDGQEALGVPNFRQVLTPGDASLRVNYGAGDAAIAFQLWVDARRPVIVVEVESQKPTTVRATIEMWRTNEVVVASSVSDVFARSPNKEIMTATRDHLAHLTSDQIGWYHHNTNSVGPKMWAELQGVADFQRQDPLLHRTFGALVSASRPTKEDHRTLVSTSGTRHLFEIAVHTQHPATVDTWQSATGALLQEAQAVPLHQRRQAHEQWWHAFWQRSWINVTQNTQPRGTSESPKLPANQLPLSIGQNSRGGSRFGGQLGRVSVYERVLPATEIAKLAQVPRTQPAPAHAHLCASHLDAQPQALAEFAPKTFEAGVTIEAWVYAEAGFPGDGRIADKVMPGGADGWLFDTYPGNSLRVVAGATDTDVRNVLQAKVWQHVAAVILPTGDAQLYLNGELLNRDEQPAASVSRGYALQRYLTACSGRGAYPIKFNGSIFTVPFKNNPEYADFRRWGPGYWWQNTRLPYTALCASGDFDLLEPLFQMYARDHLPLALHRTQRHVGHAGLYMPEIVYFWGDLASDSYGWQPFAERTDKLQSNPYHKWEWVGGLELCFYLLDRYEYTADEAFLRDTALPFIEAALTFFDQHYALDDQGKLVMHPSQALETWWVCTNPMPELAGLYAVTERCLQLPAHLTTPAARDFWQGLRQKLPDLPTVESANGKLQLAPAEKFANKRNVENPEMYGVFPFRQFAVGRPNLDWALEALRTRQDSGARGWRQDDIFMAYLGLAQEAQEYIVKRARQRSSQRFPAFWGPNYDWTPDQTHGGVLMKTLQAMLLQSDGRQLYLLPAWPSDWDCDFKLHAPYQTVITGRVKDGKLVEWFISPETRRGDVKIAADFEVDH